MSAPRFGIALALLLAGCATARPVLYPNANTNTQIGGKAASDAAIQACLQQADAAGLDQPGADVARTTAGGAAIGGVGGAAAGAVYGDLGRGAGAGAAAGAAQGLVIGLFRAHQPNAVYQGYVNRCLADKGYEVIGWQ